MNEDKQTIAVRKAFFRLQFYFHYFESYSELPHERASQN